MYTKLFWKDAAERAVSTFAQSFVALLAVAAPMSGMDLLNVNYLPVLTVAAVAAALSVLKALVAAHVGDNSASLVK